jgi:uncharacterized protein
MLAMGGPATRLRLRVSPRAARGEVVGPYGTGWKVRVSSPPEGGKATEEALALVAAALAVPRARVSLAGGASSRDKVVEIAGLDHASVERRLRKRAARTERER